MTLEGKKADGSAHNLSVWNGGANFVNATWASQGFWPRTFANSYLKQLGNNSTLTIKFKASLDKSNNAATATVFPDRVYTIKAEVLINPTLNSIKGSPSNIQIPIGGSTPDTSLVFGGKGQAGQKIELRDKGAVKATITVPASGDWTHTLTAQVIGTHSYTVKALYGSGAETVVWTLTVVTAIVATLDSIKGSPSNTEIPNGGATPDTTLVFGGKGQAGQKIELRDKGAVKATITVPASGDWTHTLTAQAIGAHSYTVKSLYGNGAETAARTLNVSQAIVLEDFECNAPWVIYPTQTKSIGTMDITFVSTGTSGIPQLSARTTNAIGGFPIGRVSGNALLINQGTFGPPTNFNIRLNLKTICRRVDFAYLFMINFDPRASVKADFYNTTGAFAGSFNLITKDWVTQQATFTGTGISSITISGSLSYALWLDTFEFYL
jgi:hypothetical protein